jgi:hypothetical protein
MKELPKLILMMVVMCLMASRSSHAVTLAKGCLKVTPPSFHKVHKGQDDGDKEKKGKKGKKDDDDDNVEQEGNHQDGPDDDDDDDDGDDD